jgi:SOS-response transcriptional repressor LexA
MLDNPNMTEPGGKSSAMYDALMAVKPEGMSLNKWAARAGINRSIFNGIRAHGNPTSDTLQKLLDAVGVSLSALYDRMPGREGSVLTEVRGTGLSAHDVEREWRGPERQKPVPLYGTAFGGEWSDGVELTELHLTEALDYLARPQAVAGDAQAYAVEIVGDSMVPRYEPRERAVVSPRAQVRIGDDVIVQLKGTGAAAVGEDGRTSEGSQLADKVTQVLIKRLVKRAATFVELEQFNPPQTFRVPTDRISAMHRVMVRL